MRVVVVVADCTVQYIVVQLEVDSRLDGDSGCAGGGTVIMMMRLKAVLYPCAFATRPTNASVHDAN